MSGAVAPLEDLKLEIRNLKTHLSAILDITLPAAIYQLSVLPEKNALPKDEALPPDNDSITRECCMRHIDIY